MYENLTLVFHGKKFLRRTFLRILFQTARIFDIYTRYSNPSKLRILIDLMILWLGFLFTSEVKNISGLLYYSSTRVKHGCCVACCAVSQNS